MKQQTGPKLGKDYVKPVYCHSGYLTYAGYIMQNAGQDEAKDGIKIARRNINNLRYADNTTLIAQMVKNPLVMQEIRIRFLGQEDPLEKRMATHSSTLAWRIPWTKETGGLQSTVSQRIRHDWVTTTMAESTEELKSFLMKVKEESEKSGLKHSEN